MSDTQDTQTVKGPSNRRTRVILVAVAVVLVIVVLVHVLGRKPPAHGAPPQVVNVAKATSGDMPETYMELGTVPGIETMVAAFTTDIPALPRWGQPLLIGPGSIHVAHTEGEYIEKKQLLDAIDLYAKIARQLLGMP